MSSAFYVPERGRFVASELTRGPWDPTAQHAGPPAALIAREIERCESPVAGDARWRVGRVTYEILRPVPLGVVTVAARVERPGRAVEMLSAELSAGDEVAIRARAWRVAIGDVALPAGLASEEPTSAARRLPEPPGPGASQPKPFFATGEEVGYHTAMEVRFASGGFVEPGPATVWMRPRQPLVAGESLTPLQRVMVAADSGNGVSATLDPASHVFINVDLSVHLHRMPVGEWVCLEAVTVPEPSGLGLADAALHDERGPIGRALQTLLIRER
jgi:hypothetical protein